MLTADRLLREVVTRSVQSLREPFDVALEWLCIPPGFPKTAVVLPETVRAIVGQTAWRTVELGLLDTRNQGWGLPLLAVPVDAVATSVVLALDAAGWNRVAVERLWPGTGRTNESLEDRARLVAQRAGERVWTLTASAQWGFLFPMRLTASVRRTIPATRWAPPTAP